MATVPIGCQPQQSICVVQTPINPAMNSRANMVQLGYLSYPTFVTPVPVPQHAYTSGFNPQGKMIGTNVAVPYPTKTPYVYRPRSSINGEITRSSTSANESKTLGCEPEETSPEIEEYFTAENDEGYRKWAEKKSEAERRRQERMSNIAPFQNIVSGNKCTISNPQTVPAFDNQSASHYMPTNLISTNQTYGSYIDLKDNYYTKRHSRQMGYISQSRLVNSTTVLPKEQRSSALDVHNLVLHHVTSQKVPYNNIIPRNILTIPNKGDVMGIRETGHTFPVYTKTGLELNRPCAVGASLFASIGQQPFHARRAPMKTINNVGLSRGVPHLNQQSVSLPYSLARHRSYSGSETPIAYACVKHEGALLN